jgi:hypothetical protein
LLTVSWSDTDDLGGIAPKWHSECILRGAAVLGEKAMGEALLGIVLAGFAQIRDSRGPLIESLVFWGGFSLTANSQPLQLPQRPRP